MTKILCPYSDMFIHFPSTFPSVFQVRPLSTVFDITDSFRCHLPLISSRIGVAAYPMLSDSKHSICAVWGSPIGVKSSWIIIFSHFLSSLHDDRKDNRKKECCTQVQSLILFHRICMQCRFALFIFYQAYSINPMHVKFSEKLRYGIL